ncbi:MAG: ribulose-phosphate 3-epimerase [Planctomycetota bacterium]|jgi:ribulose-phosphate 3-epimerase
MKTLIAPSLLASDFTRIGEEIRRAEDAGVDMLHCDIMDGHFVPNLTFGPPVIESIRAITSLPLDVHLMLDNPGDFLKPFADAGADGLTIHLEAVPQPEEMLLEIGRMGKVRGLSINPDMPVERIEPFLGSIDRLLIMSVFPGFGGQSFIEGTYERLRTIRAMKGAESLEIQVDGGVSPKNAAQVLDAGANNLVAGTACFRAPDMKAAVAAMRGPSA